MAISNQPLSSKRAAWAKTRAFILGVDGAAFIEVSVLLPLMVMVAIYAMDFGLLIFNKMQVQYAAQAGAQYVIAQGTYNGPAISTTVTNATNFTAITPTSNQFCGCPSATTGVAFCAATCGPACTACATTVQGHYVSVTATAAPYTPLIPYGIAAGNYDLSATSTVRLR
jgi:Flp pilus assembly protein TadG